MIAENKTAAPWGGGRCTLSIESEDQAMNFFARGSGRAVRLGGVTGGLLCALLGGIVTLVRAGEGPQGSSPVADGQATRRSRLVERFLIRASTSAESKAPSSTDAQKPAEAASV